MNVADFMQWIATARRHPLSALCGTIVILCGVACWYIYGNMKWLDIEHKQVIQDGDLDLASMISGPSVKQERLAALEVAHRIEDNLVIEDNLAENLWYFYKIEQQSKAHIAELRPGILQEGPVFGEGHRHLRPGRGLPVRGRDGTAPFQHHVADHEAGGTWRRPGHPGV
jgi:hypothetical protein